MVIGSIKFLLGFVLMWSTFVVIVGLLKGWLKRKSAPEVEPSLRFACVICAHNEEAVIHRPIESILKSDYPEGKLEVVVFADNCVDKTAEIARSFPGVRVIEKTTPSYGKGEVLAWGLDILRADGKYDAVSVVDADNAVDSKWLKRLAMKLEAGEDIVTGYRIASNPYTNLITFAYAVYWNLMNELYNRVREELRLSSMLAGTGFAFKLEILGDEGWRTNTFSEDLEFAVQQNLKGRRVAYVADALFYDEQPIKFRAMWRQLNRWATGTLQVLYRYVGPWLKTVFRKPSLRLLDSFSIIFLGISGIVLILVDLVTFDYSFVRGFFTFCWASGFLATLLSRFSFRSVVRGWLVFPFFIMVMTATVIYSIVHPQKRWKPIAHGN